MNEHEEGQHATLSPSSAERWLACPASVRMAAQVPRSDDKGSFYAYEGTVAHAMAEAKARAALLERLDDLDLGIWEVECAKYDFDFDSMHRHTDAYVEFLRGRLEAAGDGATLFLEQRVYTGIKHCWGTSDAILISWEHSYVETIDLKYGRGVSVVAEGNAQLRLYSIGALETIGDLIGDITDTHMTVFQPRVGPPQTAQMSATDLRVWRDGIAPTAAEALAGSDRFGPSEEACRWCPASGLCRAQMEFTTARDFSTDPEVFDADDMAEAVAMLPMIRQWANAVEEKALDMAYSRGIKIPGYKVVLSGGRRSVVDPKGLVAALRQGGIPDEEFCSLKPLGIGDLEKNLGENFVLAEPFIRKSDGKPSLVLEDDERNDINPYSQAAKDFE